MSEMYEKVDNEAAGPTAAPPKPPQAWRSATSSSPSSSSSTGRSKSSSTWSRRCGRSPRRRTAPLTRRRSRPPAPTPDFVHMAPAFNPPPGPPPAASTAQHGRGLRRQRFRRFTVDFLEVVDSDVFDLKALQAAFSEARVMVDTTVMKLRERLSKMHRLFEQGRQFFLH